MSAKNFKFVSPGVFIEEIDNSQLPQISDAIGPVVIGRSRRGPAFIPTTVQSFSEFVTIFGDPVAGQEASDQWRSGVPKAPTFAAYAAQAWLKNSSPLTFVRLLGDQSSQAANETTAKAGWTAADTSRNSGGSTDGTGGGAYGLFLINSGSTGGTLGAGGTVEDVDGTLAAVIYSRYGAPILSGTIRGGDLSVNGTTATGSNVFVESLDGAPNYSFKLRLINQDGAAGGTTNPANPQGVIEETVINFSRSSNNYIRKVLNTDPTKTNTNLVDTDSDVVKSYFLGQTYERAVVDTITGSSCYGVILQLGGETNVDDGGKFKYATQAAQTGWFFSQDLRNTAGDADSDLNQLVPEYNPEVGQGVVDRLFKFHTISTGEEEQRRYKISIEDIRYSRNDNNPYGSFTVSIRDIKDNDGARVYVERYSNCNLDPSSPNYLAKKIGDRYYQWDEQERRVVEYGTYENLSNIVRVEMAPAVDASQVNPEVLPFGNEGPIKYSDFTITSANQEEGFSDQTTTTLVTPVVLGSGSSYPMNFGSLTGSANRVRTMVEPDWAAPLTASINFPEVPLRLSASTGELANQKDAYFGATFTRTGSSVVYDQSMQDVVYPLAGAASSFVADNSETETSWYFSLDDVVDADGTATALGSVFYQSGSRALGTSATAMSGTYKAILDKGFDQFTAPMFGGFNGFNIFEKEPFQQYGTDAAIPDNAPETEYAMAYSVRKAIDMFADPEFVEGNLLTAPGIVNEGLTTHMINTCEGRGDAMAIIDPKGGYTPASADARTEENRIATNHVRQVVDNMTARALNSSYGATYYPWVRISDTITGASLWAPPSVAAFGAMSFNDNQAAPWFAPAGFNRGGLSAGAAGIPVTNVRSKLTSKERDSLYDANINPIASFPNEGIVIFGQKTLQVTPSALDRINVRRLMIFVKKEISRIAANLLFEPNVPATWARFTSQVNPFLFGIKNDFGLDAFKVVLDETTTTPDLIDRNVIYAKIFLKPTKAVEFFAIDFVITNSGAGFED